jgi:hypothetical protein
MRATKQISLLGTELEITQLGARTARPIALQLAQWVTGALAKGSTEVEMLARFAAQIDHASYAQLVRTMASATVVLQPVRTNVASVARVAFNDDEFFAGQFGAEVRWLLACLELNFASFFADLTAIGQDVQATANNYAPPKA